MTDITMITEVEVTSVPNIEKFKQYLNRYDFNAAYILDKFFKEAIEILLSSDRYPKAIAIFASEEDGSSKFLRLGITETNLETIPFNPLTLFVRTKTLVKTVQNIELGLKQGVESFDFYRYGLFNVLNTLTKAKSNIFLSVKDLEEEKVLYSLRVRNGQVVSASTETERIAQINTDDSIPKTVAIGPVPHEDKVIFKNTAEFYSALLEVEEKAETTAVIVPKELPKPELVTKFKENLLRERRVYSLPYREHILYTQIPEGGNLEKKALVAVAELSSETLMRLRTHLMKNPDLKLVAPPVVKAKLKSLGFSEKNFLLPEGVKTEDTPFLGSKFEGYILLPEGILITGNLFGSFVSRDVPFLDRIFFSHVRVFHLANVSSSERLRVALEKLEPLKGSLSYIFPSYGYAVDMTLSEAVFEVVSNVDLPLEYRTLSMEWKHLAEAYGIEAGSYEEFLKLLSKKDGALLFNLLDDMEVLGIVPLEL